MSPTLWNHDKLATNNNLLRQINDKSGIYTITNIVNGKIYVGCSLDVKHRLSIHLNTLRKKIHANKHLQRAFNIDGEHNFEFEILENYPVEVIIDMEIYWINLLNTTSEKFGYNQYVKWNGNAVKKVRNTKPIVALTLEGSFIREFKSQSEAARFFEIQPVSINQCIRKVSKHAGGVVFMDKEIYINTGYAPPPTKFLYIPKKSERIIREYPKVEIRTFDSFEKGLIANNSEFSEFFDLIANKT